MAPKKGRGAKKKVIRSKRRCTAGQPAPENPGPTGKNEPSRGGETTNPEKGKRRV